MNPAAGDLHLVAPMAGGGDRFRRAGYDVFKPFIDVCGSPMIRYVTDAFPRSVQKHVIACREMLTDDQVRFLENDLGCRLIFIEPHPHGPAWSILQAADRLPRGKPLFVSYCDIAWSWDFDSLGPVLEMDAAVFTHRGFHPHLVGDNFSAFCLPEENDPGRMKGIREKGSFTSDWMNEPVSIGLFYARDSGRLLRAVGDMIRRDERVAGEFYPSVAFNDLIADGAAVGLVDLPFFVHWGVPDQLEDFLRWKRIVRSGPVAETGDDLPENVMCMAGSGRRLAADWRGPKALIPVLGRPLWAHTASRFPASGTFLVTAPPVSGSPGLEAQGAKVHRLARPTASQLDTLLAVKPELMARRDFFLTSCDAYGSFNFRRFRSRADEIGAEAAVFTFRPSLTQRKISQHYTHVDIENGWIRDIHIKSGGEKGGPGLAGFFWIRDGRLFGDLEKARIDDGHEPIADHAFRHLVRSGRRVMDWPLEEYVHLGTAEELKEFFYWTGRDHLFTGNRFDFWGPAAVQRAGRDGR